MTGLLTQESAFTWSFRLYVKAATFRSIKLCSGFIIQISPHAGKRETLSTATSCHMTLSYHFTKPSAENTQLWWKSVLSNKLSRINIAKLISFLTENQNLIKQPPDATSSPDSAQNSFLNSENKTVHSD
ncbi:hypothetical protein AVEN_30881-1 [Araneus ventricosus]|uniref:Uncharacterized protein n=1 Tax=Araneus ventricosus TaxID=182803 RepID=A0A4Y2HW05_ARAVE|nr:hypothetical protein AVEN_26646-1 [Araneus ventricosus]GBM69677.1 hypothetical protein AVEN_30881-1 [Araneus ventricosus]